MIIGARDNMSSLKRIKGLTASDFMESSVQTLWRWHVLNALPFIAATKVEDCFVHRQIAIEVIGKSHLDARSQANSLTHIAKHKHDNDLLRYGDLLKEK